MKLPPEAPVRGYSLANAFASMQFTNPRAVAVPPGETNRLFVVERGGRIIVLTNLAAPTRTVFLDLSSSIDPDYLLTGEEGLLAHPAVTGNYAIPPDNYGWAFLEGSQTSLKEDMPPPPAGFVSVNPIWEYVHDTGIYDGYAAVGGVVYRGNRLGQLAGRYIFGDYVAGHIWSLAYDGVTPVIEWLTSDSGIAAFGTDPRNGDVLVIDHDEGIIRRVRRGRSVAGRVWRGGLDPGETVYLAGRCPPDS